MSHVRNRKARVESAGEGPKVRLEKLGRAGPEGLGAKAKV